jgi:hypothetical protein
MLIMAKQSWMLLAGEPQQRGGQIAEPKTCIARDLQATAGNERRQDLLGAPQQPLQVKARSSQERLSRRGN